MLKSKNIMAKAGAVILFAGLFFQFFKLTFAPYVYLLGAILFAYVQVIHTYHGNNVVIRRLYRQQQISSILLVVTGVLMIFMHRNEWIVCLAIAAFLQLYTAFRIPQEEEKEK